MRFLSSSFHLYKPLTQRPPEGCFSFKLTTNWQHSPTCFSHNACLACTCHHWLSSLPTTCLTGAACALDSAPTTGPLCPRGPTNLVPICPPRSRRDESYLLGLGTRRKYLQPHWMEMWLSRLSSGPLGHLLSWAPCLTLPLLPPQSMASSDTRNPRAPSSPLVGESSLSPSND